MRLPLPRRRHKGLRPELVAYLKVLPGMVGSPSTSEFWRRQLARSAASYAAGDTLGEQGLATLVAEGSYGFESLPNDLADVLGDPGFQLSIETLRSAEKILRAKKPVIAAVDKHVWEHARAIAFLEREALLPQYLEFIRPLRLRSTMSSARHWYYARMIDQLLDQRQGNKTADFLEIGAGAGNLAYFLTVLGRVRSYTIIDLPEMLVHSGFTLATRLPSAKLSFVTAAEQAVDPPAEDRYAFVTPDASGALPEVSADAALNVNSFMEMDRAVRDRYFDLVYRLSRPGGLFLNINRRQRALPLPGGDTWDNNPLLYPYRSDDDILLWEEERFQTATRSDFNFSSSLAVIRAGIVGQ